MLTVEKDIPHHHRRLSLLRFLDGGRIRGPLQLRYYPLPFLLLCIYTHTHQYREREKEGREEDY